MKRIVAALIAGLCLMASAGAQENLIPNGDMSSWKKRAHLPVGFKMDPREGADEYFGRADEQHDGKNAVYATYCHKNQGSTRYISTPHINLEAGTYRLTFYVKGRGFMRTVVLAPADAAEPDKRSVRSNNGCISKSPMENSSMSFSDWTPITLTFNVCKAGKYDLNLSFNNKKSGSSLLVSDLSLIKI